MKKDIASDRFNQRGIKLADKGWLGEAVREFNQAIDADRDSPFPLLNRASVYLEQDRHLEALEDLLAALKMAPEESATHYHLGVFFARYAPRLALTQLNQSLSLDPDHLDALLQLGVVQADRGEPRSAEASFRAALEVDPEDPLANREMGVLLMEQGKVHEAIDYLKLACDGLNNDFETMIDLGMAYIQAGFYERAEKVLTEVLNRDDGNLHAHYNLAAVFADWGKKDRALHHLNRAADAGQHQVREWVRDDKMFDRIRTDPQFESIMGEVTLQTLRS